MRIVPAIDLRDGACVQLVGGDYAAERVRLADPAAVARRWAEAGCARLHVVDLDAATGRGENDAAIGAILAELEGRGVEIQLGGGLRDTAAVERRLASGITRVVIGTRGLEDPEWLATIATRHPRRVVLAADVRDGRVVSHGWSRALDLTPHAWRARVRDLPLAAMLVTAVDVEGTLAGPDLPLFAALAAADGPPLIAAGGIGSLEDLKDLADLGIQEAVIGMALYTGAIAPVPFGGELS